jgi:hypothetical protein
MNDKGNGSKEGSQKESSQNSKAKTRRQGSQEERLMPAAPRKQIYPVALLASIAMVSILLQS